MEKDKTILHIDTKAHQPSVADNVLQFITLGIVPPNETDADITWKDGTHSFAGGYSEFQAIDNAKRAEHYTTHHVL